MEHVVVTGVGIVSPIGTGAKTFWRHLLEGKRAIAPMPDRSKLSGNGLWAAVADDFLDRSSVPRAALRNTDRFAQYAMAAAHEALDCAHFEPPADRTAVIIGNTMGGFPSVAQAQTRFLDDPRSVTPKLMALVIPNMASARIAMHWNLHGPQLAISTACASSLDAIGLAAGMIERGEVDAAIAGGSETLLSPLVYESLVRAGALSRNPDAARASRPFDVDRDGFVMGDGAGVIVLERADLANARAAPILARVRGYGSVADAHHITSPDPSAFYEVRAMRDAIERAGDAGKACDVVYAHATGTIVGDAAESKAIDEVYAGRPPIVTSIKGHLGHSMASAGAICTIAGIAGMHDGVIPPTMGTQRVDPQTRFDLVTERPRAYGHSSFQVNAFGFGGQNASLIFSL
ncbi:MAG TPA: beta-ketoacyl-[acyl-carrier-protein] synthase family protein [Candidatus Dormibacteraeota bacterium]|jgi:3-oxoacyl-[acyl-carrier-protein] synthase II|nr:beta-ketoacyl-[acyl-carrier-protein] synthase family protein [Candidatus Dormibacteraeota bacterium]